MAAPKKTARTIAEEVCSRFPETPTMTLAKKLFAENPEVYNNIEHARTSVRMIRGKSGAKHKKVLSDKSLIDKSIRPLNPFALPKSYAKKRKHVELKGSVGGHINRLFKHA